MASLKEQIVAVGLKREAVKIPEWETEVFIRRLACGEREELTGKCKLAKETNAPVALDRELVAICLCDEKGERLFSADELKAIDGLVLKTLFEHAQRVNTIGDYDKTEAA
ncbi:MAG TPA: hypothetical protein VEK08_00440 [Planctomycetota bacterium]|nr:hypothetical protein [Planctomycetota bacterium]